MAYYFMVNKKKEGFTPLDIKKTDYFPKPTRYKGLAMSLAEADSFTMMFDNEEELRRVLIEENVLEYADLNRDLSIRQLKKGEYEKVMYDFLYQKDLEFIIDPNRVVKLINERFRNQDYLFIQDFAKTFKNFHDCSSTGPEVAIYINNTIIYGFVDHHLFIHDENNDDMLTRMVKLLIFDHFFLPSGKVIYKDTVNYRQLHSIIAFINNYDKKHKDDILDNQDNVTKPKTLSKKRKSIPGQINLFD